MQSYKIVQPEFRLFATGFVLFVFLVGTPILAQANDSSEPKSFASEIVVKIIDTASVRFDSLPLFALLWLILFAIGLICLRSKESGVPTLSVISLICASAIVLIIGTSFYGCKREVAIEKEIKAFLVLGNEVSVGPFKMVVQDIDTLKARIKAPEDVKESLRFNTEKFGEESLNRFLSASMNRLQELNFKEPNGLSKAKEKWPKYSSFTNEESFRTNLTALESIKVHKRSDTNETKNLREALSEWPLCQLKVTFDGRELLNDKFYPEKFEIPLNVAGQKYYLTLDTIFNGSRTLDQAEACAVTLKKQ